MNNISEEPSRHPASRLGRKPSGFPELFGFTRTLHDSDLAGVDATVKVKDLHAKLIAWRKEVGVLMPTPTPNIEGKKSKKPKRKENEK